MPIVQTLKTGISGVRGVVGDSFTPQLVSDFGQAFGTYLGLGLTSLIAFQAVVNMAVAMGLVPTKGLTLPFISYGGSSLIVLMGSAGLLLSISTSVEGGKKRARVTRPTPAAVQSGAEATA